MPSICYCCKLYTPRQSRNCNISKNARHSNIVFRFLCLNQYWLYHGSHILQLLNKFLFNKTKKFRTVFSLVESEIIHLIGSSSEQRKIEMNKFIALLIIGSILLNLADAGPAAYGICQAGCAAVVVACYAASGATFGTITGGAAIPAVIVACNSAFGTCQAACWAALVAPTPWYGLIF